MVAEAPTLEDLLVEVKQIVPELLHLNHGLRDQDAAISLVADRLEAVRLPA